ncbi:exodeoxyribonuclease VII large subunit, partial [Turicimonas muris]
MTVSEAVQKIDWTVKSMRTLLVEGEISSFNNNRASGHWYFAI